MNTSWISKHSDDSSRRNGEVIKLDKFYCQDGGGILLVNKGGKFLLVSKGSNFLLVSKGGEFLFVVTSYEIIKLAFPESSE